MGKNQNSVVVLWIWFKFWCMIPMVLPAPALPPEHRQLAGIHFPRTAVMKLRKKRGTVLTSPQPDWDTDNGWVGGLRPPTRTQK